MKAARITNARPGESAPRTPTVRRMAACVAGTVISALTCLVGSAGAGVQDSLVQLSPTPTAYVDRTDFFEMTGSAARDVTAPVWAVDLGLTWVALGRASEQVERRGMKCQMAETPVVSNVRAVDSEDRGSPHAFSINLAGGCRDPA